MNPVGYEFLRKSVAAGLSGRASPEEGCRTVDPNAWSEGPVDVALDALEIVS